jgi:hypothetical protein
MLLLEDSPTSMFHGSSFKLWFIYTTVILHSIVATCENIYIRNLEQSLLVIYWSAMYWRYSRSLCVGSQPSGRDHLVWIAPPDHGPASWELSWRPARTSARCKSNTFPIRGNTDISHPADEHLRKFQSKLTEACNNLTKDVLIFLSSSAACTYY